MCISEASKAIIAMPKNGGWDMIGLFDVGELAARLTDIDIHAVLSVTDAQNKLKSLWFLNKLQILKPNNHLVMPKPNCFH